MLFKAKCTDNGEWVEGDIFHNHDGRIFCGELIIDDYKGDACDKYNLGIGFCEVDPETICQYTGLYDSTRWKQITEEEKKEFLSKWNRKENRYNKKKDWKGKKIWENDIVETVYDGNLNPNYVVVWDKDELDFKATNGEKHYKTDFEYLGCCEEIIVIGNVFDNTELL